MRPRNAHRALFAGTIMALACIQAPAVQAKIFDLDSIGKAKAIVKSVKPVQQSEKKEEYAIKFKDSRLAKISYVILPSNQEVSAESGPIILRGRAGETFNFLIKVHNFEYDFDLVLPNNTGENYIRGEYDSGAFLSCNENAIQRLGGLNGISRFIGASFLARKKQSCQGIQGLPPLVSSLISSGRDEFVRANRGLIRYRP